MPSWRSSQTPDIWSKYPPISERHFEIVLVNTLVWFQIERTIEERRGLVPEIYYVQQGHMGSDGLPEYRLRAADGQPVYGEARLSPEDDWDGWYKDYKLQKCDQETG